MARSTSEKVGRGPCPSAGCGETVAYRLSRGGLLTHKCDACDSTGYAEPGGKAYKSRMASLTEKHTPEGAESGPVPVVAPGPKRTASAFELGNL